MALTLPKFQQDGTGAVNRDVGDKLKEFVSVKDFGAVGDGVTDDTAAIQATISYVDTFIRNKPIVYLPSGVYITTSPIVIGSDAIVLQGAGQSVPWNSKTSATYEGGTCIKYSGSALDTDTEGVFILGSTTPTSTFARNCVFRDFAIEAVYSANGFRCANTNSCSFINITTDQCEWGIRFFDTNNNSNLIEGCEFYDPPTNGGGLDLRNTCHNTTVSECRFNNKTTGTRNPSYAIRIAADSNCSNVTIQNCNFDYYRVVTSHVYISNDCKGFNFTGNYIEGRNDGVTADLLIIAGLLGGNISGNRFSASSGLSDYGVDIYSTGGSVSITGNYFSGFLTACIRVASGATNVFSAGNNTNGITEINDQNALDSSVSVNSGIIRARDIIVDTISSGTYAATSSSLVAPVTYAACTVNPQYMRVGNIVNVSGRVTVTTNAAGEGSFILNIPIPSSLANGGELAGVAFNSTSKDSIEIQASTPTDSALFSINTSAAITGQTFAFIFSYQII